MSGVAEATKGNEAVQDDTQSAQEASASLNAGFEAVRGKSEPVTTDSNSARPTETGQQSSTTTLDAKTTTTDEPAGDKPGEIKQPEEPIVMAGMTESQIKAILAKASRFDELEGRLQKAFGSIGQQQQVLNELRKSTQSGSKPITQATFKRLENELGPEIAQAIAQDLGELLGPTGDAPKDEPKTVAAPAEQPAINRDFIKAEVLLEVKHPDWKKDLASDDFSIWLGGLDPNVSRAVQSSADPGFIHQALDAFTEWKAKAAAAAQAEAKKTNRLSRAVAPQGSGATQTVLPDSEGLSRGFNAVRGHRLRPT